MALKPESTESLLCAWNDHGVSCNFKGMRSMSTFGGPWYCREHYYKLMGYHGMEGKRGNALPDPITTSVAVEAVRKNLKPRVDSAPLSKYLPAVREPGEDKEEQSA